MRIEAHFIEFIILAAHPLARLQIDRCDHRRSVCPGFVAKRCDGFNTNFTDTLVKRHDEISSFACAISGIKLTNNPPTSKFAREIEL